MKKLISNINLQIKNISNFGHSNNLFNQSNSKKQFAFTIPYKSVKIPEEIKEGKEKSSDTGSKKITKKDRKNILKSNNYDAKFRFDANDLDDYIIHGKEIHKNKFKDALLKKQNGEISQKEFQKLMENDEDFSKSIDHFKYFEYKGSKRFFRRPFYAASGYKYKHFYSIPREDNIEPFNAIPMYKFSIPGNDPEKIKSLIYKRNNHISGFLPPFEIGNQKLDQIQKKLKDFTMKYKIDLNSEDYIHKVVNDSYNEPEKSPFIPENTNKEYLKAYLHLQKNLLDEIQTISYKVIPNLLMKFVFELGFNDKYFWVILEQMILDNLHHYSVSELAKIFYVATYACPKFTTDFFRSQIYNEIYNQLENIGLDDLLHVMFGFRESKNKKIYDKIANILMAKKDSFIVNKADDLSKLIYTYASHKPKTYGVNTLTPQRDLLEKFVLTFENDLMENIMKMNIDQLVKIASGLYLLRVENVDAYTNRVERRLLKLIEKENKTVDAFSISSIIKAFSKMKYNKMCGSDKFFSEIEDFIKALIEKNQFSPEEFSDVAYAYSIRGNLSDKMKNSFNTYIEKNAKDFKSYHVMHNIFYYFMFTDCLNYDAIDAILNNYDNLKVKLPVVYYRAFKLFDYYVVNCKEKEKFNHFAIRLREKFYHAEQIYDFVKYERMFNETEEIRTFDEILRIRMIKEPITCLVKNNLLIIHFCFPQYKIGINIWPDRYLVPKVNGNMRINQQYLLNSKLLKMKDWDILDLNWEEYQSIGDQIKKDEFIHNWYENTKISQHKKGIVNIKPKFV